MMKSWTKRGGMAAALVVLVLLVSGCNPCARLSRRCPPAASRTDSIYIHDTIIRTEKVLDTAMLLRLLQRFISVTSPAGDTAYAETEYARAMAWLCGKNICLNMWNKDSGVVDVPKIEVTEQHLRETSRVSESVEVKTERYIPWFVRVMAWAGGLLIAYHVGKVFIKVVVRYMRV